MSKAFVFGFVAGLSLLIVAGVGGSLIQQRDAEEKLYQAELVDATPLQIGALTEKQRIHSRLYTHYRERRGDQTISGLITSDKGKDLGIVFNMPLTELLTEPETPESYFGKLADESDAVIRGRATNKVSHITEDDAFVFTDYDVVVTQVLKNNTASSANIGEAITVTHPGGKVVVNGVIVKVEDEAFAPLPVNNDVVLFLTFIPETGAYRLTRHSGSFELDGRTLRPLTGAQFPPGVIRDADSFLRTVQAVSNQ
jgi:hypothetical protein